MSREMICYSCRRRTTETEAKLRLFNTNCCGDCGDYLYEVYASIDCDECGARIGGRHAVNCIRPPLTIEAEIKDQVG